MPQVRVQTVKINPPLILITYGQGFFVFNSCSSRHSRAPISLNWAKKKTSQAREWVTGKLRKEGHCE